MSYISLNEEQAEALSKFNLPAFSYLYLWRYLSDYQRRKARSIENIEERIEYVISGLNRRKRLPESYSYLLQGKKWNGFTGILEPEFEKHPPYFYGI